MMKTKKIISVCICLAALFTACKKKTPLTIDSVPPGLTLQLSGGGTSHTFETSGTGRSPEGTFFYRENTRYHFTVTLADTSGLGQLIFRITKSGAVNFLEITGSPAAVAVTNTRFHEYSIITERTDPFTSFLITGSFVTGTELGDSEIQFEIIGRDYLPNTTNLYVDGNVYMQAPAGDFGWHSF